MSTFIHFSTWICSLVLIHKSLMALQMNHITNEGTENPQLKYTMNAPVENTLEIFEKDIAYFFGVPNEQPVIEAYLNALQKLNLIGIDSKDLLYQEMMPYLEQAYSSIAQQRKWDFNIHLAADLEFQIIMGNMSGSSFESVSDLMIQLYTVVFRSDSPLIPKAAWLRTFLYQYKASLLKNAPSLCHQDQTLLLQIAATSKSYLNAIE